MKSKIAQLLMFVSLSCLAPLSFAQSHQTNLISDFEYISKTDDSAGIHTSKTKIYRQKSDGTKWIIKSGPDRWLINEFVSGKIYQLLLGKDIVSDSKLVLNQHSGKRYLATQVMERFTPVNVLSKQMDHFPFYCALGGCVCTASSCIKKQIEFSTISKKQVVGFERAALASLLLDDDDLDGGNNFALVELDDKFVVTRFDFDDSLKFFDRIGITNLDAADIMSASQLKEYASQGMSRVSITKLLKQQLLPYNNARLENIWSKLRISSASVNPERIQTALRELTDEPFSTLASLVDAQFQIVAQYYSDDEMGTIYDTKKSLCSHNLYPTTQDVRVGHDFEQYNCRLSGYDANIAIVSEFTKFMLHRRYNDLKALQAKNLVREEL